MTSRRRAEAISTGPSNPGTKASEPTKRILIVTSLIVVLMAGACVVLGSWALAPGGAAAVVVASMILSRRPGNGVGRALLAFGLAAVLSDFCSGYTARLYQGDALPAARLMVTLDASIGVVLVLVTCAILLLVYPSGSPSGRWRWLLRGLIVIGALGCLAGVAWAATKPVAEVAEIMTANVDSGNPAELASAATFVLGLPLAIISLFLRYRSGSRVERAQIRWLFFAAGVLLASIVALNIVNDWDNLFSSVVTAAVFLLFPLAIGVALGRHHLFEIDRIISRTVSYGVLTTILGGVYVGVVFLLRVLLPVRGQIEVAVSTLAAAALFNPMRRRVQAWVDSRFNRARYDAGRIVDEIVQRLRSTMTLDQLGSELQTVTAETMQPVRIGLWIPGGEG